MRNRRDELKMRTAFQPFRSADESGRCDGASRRRAFDSGRGACRAKRWLPWDCSGDIVVHGLDGLDEITTTGETRVLEIRGGAIARTHGYPRRFRGSRAPNPEDLKGADKETNCAYCARDLERRHRAAARHCALSMRLRPLSRLEKPRAFWRARSWRQSRLTKGVQRPSSNNYRTSSARWVTVVRFSFRQNR